jgi:methyl-accepting chemotaxis protein
MSHATRTSSDRPATRTTSLRAMLTTFTVGAVVAAAIPGAVSVWSAMHAERAAGQTFAAKDITADILPPPLYLIEMRLVLSQAAEGNLAVDAAQAEFKRLQGEYEARVTYWKEHPTYGLDARLFGAQHEGAIAFMAAAAKALDVIASHQDAAAVKAAIQTAHAAYQAHRTGVDATVKDANAFADASVASFESVSSLTVRAQVALVTLAALGLAAAGLWIGRSIWRSVGGEPAEAAAVANAIALGDLASRLDAPADERSIMAALVRMREALAAIVAQVRASSDNIASGSRQIAEGNNDLSGRTEQQAAALEETAASMEQLSATVKRNADNARQANQLALSASSVAVQGGLVVGEVVGTMKAINDSSRRIADIIGVIDGIAFQTNILALNAAVEAARAGEQGRGFAVVASEVRNLAQRSAEAAKEIKSLISTSVERVEQGTALVDQAGTTMNEIVGSIKRVTDIMGEISTASVEQSAGVGQVSEAVSQMDQATQQNAALVEQSASAATNLKEQADDLVAAVSVFKLAHDRAHAAPSARAAEVVPGDAAWRGDERRGADRATNVERPAFGTRRPESAPALDDRRFESF